MGLKYLRKREPCEVWPLPARDGACWDWGWIVVNPARAARIRTYRCCNKERERDEEALLDFILIAIKDKWSEYDASRKRKFTEI